ncbi:MAG: hypothetical protein AAF963_02990 [Bacteroidota bacterium]
MCVLPPPPLFFRYKDVLLALLILGGTLITSSCAFNLSEEQQQLSKNQQIDQLLKGLETYRAHFTMVWKKHLALAKPKEAEWRRTIILYLKQTVPRYHENLKQEWEAMSKKEYLMGLDLNLEQAFTLLNDKVWEEILEKNQRHYTTLYQETSDTFMCDISALFSPLGICGVSVRYR